MHLFKDGEGLFTVDEDLLTANVVLDEAGFSVEIEDKFKDSSFSKKNEDLHETKEGLLWDGVEDLLKEKEGLLKDDDGLFNEDAENIKFVLE